MTEIAGRSLQMQNSEFIWFDIDGDTLVFISRLGK